MKFYTLIGSYCRSTFLISEIESIITTAQKKQTTGMSDCTIRTQYFVVVNFKSGNFVRIGYANEADRDHDFKELQDFWISQLERKGIWKH